LSTQCRQGAACALNQLKGNHESSQTRPDDLAGHGLPTGTGLNLFTLPAGSRPSAILQFPTRCGDGIVCYIAISPAGAVDFGPAPGATPDLSVSLDGISFDTR
jgi:hypothetical protein